MRKFFIRLIRKWTLRKSRIVRLVKESVHMFPNNWAGVSFDFHTRTLIGDIDGLKSIFVRVDTYHDSLYVLGRDKYGPFSNFYSLSFITSRRLRFILRSKDLFKSSEVANDRSE